MPTPQSSFRLTASDQLRLDALAAAMNATRTDVLRVLIRAEFERQEIEDPAAVAFLRDLRAQHGDDATLAITTDGDSIAVELDGQPVQLNVTLVNLDADTAVLEIDVDDATTIHVARVDLGTPGTEITVRRRLGSLGGLVSDDQ